MPTPIRTVARPRADEAVAPHRPPVGRRRRTASLLLVAVLGVGLTACSGQSSDDGAFTPPTTRDPSKPASMGETCDDPAGDLSNDAKTTAPGTLAEPAGIDLTRASTAVEGDNLVVDLTTVAPPGSATNPEFFVDSGDPQAAPAASWELRLAPTGGTWKATLVQFPTSLGARDKRTPLTVPVSVRDNRILATIPLSQLPPIATTLWLFGASAGASDATRIFDECLPFQPTTGTTGAPGPTTTRSGPTTSLPTGAIGQTLTAPDGAKVTVESVAVPARPNRVPEVEPVPGSRLVAAEVQVCAGSTAIENVGEGRFTFRSTAGVGSAPWTAPAYTNDPRFPASQTVRPGECASGWITFEVAADAQVASILYDTTGGGAGPFLTFTPS